MLGLLKFPHIALYMCRTMVLASTGNPSNRTPLWQHCLASAYPQKPVIAPRRLLLTALYGSLLQSPTCPKTFCNWATLAQMQSQKPCPLPKV